MTSMTSCIVGKKIRAMGPGPLELFPFVVLAILMAMAEGISEHMLTSWSSLKTISWNRDIWDIGSVHTTIDIITNVGHLDLYFMVQ